ncbi:unnamed protein product, partial [Brachionus calyciflorus]
EVLRKLYGKEYRYNDPLIEFASRRQQPNENIYNYLCDLEQLAGAAYPDKKEPTLEPLIVDRFIRGIYDMKIKQELCRPPICNNLSDVLGKAFELEEAFTKCQAPKSIMNTNNNKNSNNRVSFEENSHTIEKYPDQEFCKHCTHHKHLAKDCFRNPNHPRNRNNIETHVRSVIKSGAKIRNNPIQTVCTEKNTCLEFQGDSHGPIQPQNATESQVDDEKSIEGMCLINEIPINFTIDTGAQITVISDRVYNSELRIGETAIFTFLVVIKGLLRETVKRLNQDLKLEPTKFLRNAIKNSTFINSLSDTDFNHYLEKINGLIKSISASSLKELKPSPCFEHEIKLIDPNLPPIRQKMRRIPYSKRDEFKKMLDEMLEAKLIQPSESSWASPLILVSKPDGSIRVTIDYRSLNERTQKDAHPLPNSEDFYVLLSKSKWYTKMDLITGYFQILMKPESRQLTAFTCEWGLFEYLVMPMGLTNAPATFQRAMNKVLKRFIIAGFVVVFLDDILIHSETLIEHFKHIELVVNELKKHCLSVKLKKCEVAKQEVVFLGHVISSGSIKPDKSKCEALFQFKRPKTLAQLQSFLGLAQYYRKFIENFAKIAAPLYKLTTKEESANKNELN